MKIPENVRLMMENRAHSIANGEYASFICDIEEQMEAAEEKDTPIVSPVEQMFLIGWNFWRRSHLCAWRPEERPGLRPQYKDKTTGKYRIDFTVDFIEAIVNCPIDSIFCNNEQEIFSRFPEPLVGIEIDGHQWHEKTKEQARRDKERERFLVAAGWKILRFTGSEVFNDTDKCVCEVLDCANSLAVPYFKSIRSYLNGKA